MKNKNSSISLLKIICMIMIIAIHYYTHGLLRYNDVNFYTVNNFNSRILFTQFIGMFGRLACSIYAIITGYYMSRKKIEIKKNLEKIIFLILEMIFYSILVLFFITLFTDLSVSKTEIFKMFFPIFWGNWYVVNYIILLCICPFINAAISKIDKENYRKMLLVFLFLWGVIPTFTGKAWTFSSIDFFIIMYLIGAYIKKYEEDFDKIPKNKIIISMIISIIILLGTVCFFDIVGILLNKDVLITKATHFNDYNNIFTISVAILLFLYFKNLKFNSKTIDVVSSTTLGIYLLHDNYYLKQIIWFRLWPNIDFINSNYIYIHALLKISGIFIVFSFIDLIRIYLLENNIKAIFSDKIEKIINKIYSKITIKKID